MSYTKDRSIYLTVKSDIRKADYYPACVGRTGIVRKLTRTRTGDRLPNYQTLIAEGKNATTNLSGYWESLDTSDMTYYVDWTYDNTRYILDGVTDATYIEYYPGPHSTPASVWDTANARASAKVFQAIRRAQVEVSGPTFLGELKETLRMLKRPVAGLQDQIARYLDNVRRRRRGHHGRRDPNNWAKDLSNLWLEQAFGWTPLIHDINDAMKAYHSLFNKDRVIKFSVGGSAFKDDGFWQNIRTGTVPGHSYHFCTRIRCNANHRVFSRYRGAIRARAATTAQDVTARFGFTPSEFVPTAWELLPWSYLFDYFANIGEILEAVVTDTSDLIWISHSQVGLIEITYLTNMEFPYGTQGTIHKFKCSPGKARYTQRTVIRDAAPLLLVPELTFRLPTSSMRLMNMTALLGQMNRTVHPQNPRPFRP